MFIFGVLITYREGLDLEKLGKYVVKTRKKVIDSVLLKSCLTDMETMGMLEVKNLNGDFTTIIKLSESAVLAIENICENNVTNLDESADCEDKGNPRKRMREEVEEISCNISKPITEYNRCQEARAKENIAAREFRCQ